MQVPVLLDKVRARALIRDALRATAVALSALCLFFLIYGLLDYLVAFSAPLRFVVPLAAGTIALACVLLATFGEARRHDRVWAASKVEQRLGTLNNELIVMAESYTAACSVAPYMRERLEAALAIKLSSTSSDQIIPLRPSRSVLALSGCVGLMYASLFILFPGQAVERFGRLVMMGPDSAEIAAGPQSDLSNGHATRAGADLVEELRMILTPPAYTRRDPSVQVGDGNILALAGTRAELIIKTRTPDSTARLYMSGASDPRMIGREGDTFKASFVISEETAYKVTVQANDEGLKWEGIYSVKAVKDAPPEVHIDRPASDLLFSSDHAPSSLAVRVRARDEFGVSAIRLKYIKATGEGDASRFESGEVKLQTAPSGDGTWSGAVNLDLGKIALEPGASVIIHAEATDNNNLTGPSSGYSENIIIQVAAPEKVRIEVDNLSPDEVLKYLTSQRMILIKTEKLHRLRGRISDQEILARSQEIAGEQRRYRESFNQFSGLEPAHDHEEESEEARSEAEPERHDAALPEIPEGGSEAVRFMVMAIRAMWRAEAELQLAKTDAAIEFEKEALLHLKSAQKGIRHVPLIAASSRPIDLKRRYQGRLDEIRNRIERMPTGLEDAASRQLFSILKTLYESARSLAGPDSRVRAVSQELDRASDDILHVRGPNTSSLVESASKLKLVRHMLEGPGEDAESEERQKAIKLIADVCGQIGAILSGRGPAGAIPATLYLNPSATSKGAAYFKLLSRREARSKKPEARSRNTLPQYIGK